MQLSHAERENDRRTERHNETNVGFSRSYEKRLLPYFMIFLLLLLPCAEFSLIAEGFAPLNDLLLPFLSILDPSCPIFYLHLANVLFDVILPSVLGSFLWSFGQRYFMTYITRNYCLKANKNLYDRWYWTVTAVIFTGGCVYVVVGGVFTYRPKARELEGCFQQTTL